MREIIAPVQNDHSFGDFIRIRRMQLNLTQADVANSVGTTQGYISRLEAGTKEPTLTLSLKICDVLGLDINEYAKIITGS